MNLTRVPLALVAIIILQPRVDAEPRIQFTKSAADVVVYRGSYPGWPWIARTPGGKLICVWREGTVHDYSSVGRLMLSTSADGGHTWSMAKTIYDLPDVDDRNVAIYCQTDRDWLISYNSYTSEKISRAWTLRSVDGGESWSPPRPVCDLDARTRAAAVPLASGELLLPFYRAPGDQSLAGISSDQGDTWTVVEIPNGAGFVGDEWDAVELPDGRIIGIIRNSAVAADPADRGWFYKVESVDRGRTWTAAQRTNLRDARSTSPAQIFLHEGRPVVLYANARMVSVVMAVTDDPQLLRWNVEEAIPCYQYRADGHPIDDGSYPVSVPVSPGERLIVDYVLDGATRVICGYRVRLSLAR